MDDDRPGRRRFDTGRLVAGWAAGVALMIGLVATAHWAFGPNRFVTGGVVGFVSVVTMALSVRFAEVCPRP